MITNQSTRRQFSASTQDALRRSPSADGHLVLRLTSTVDEPKYKKEIDKMRDGLLKCIKHTNDPASEEFENCNSQTPLKKFMAEQDAKAQRKQKKKNIKKRTS